MPDEPKLKIKYLVKLVKQILVTEQTRPKNLAITMNGIKTTLL